MNQYAVLPSPDQEVGRAETFVKSIPRKSRSESLKHENANQKVQNRNV